MSKKVGIIYSETTANNFFDKKAYSQLFASMQYQATMAGIPFDILTEADLTDITKICHCQALIFPSLQNVPIDRLSEIEQTLRLAVFKYKIGCIVSGNFITNDETGLPLSGDPYQRMKELLDLQITHSHGLKSNVSLKIKDINNFIVPGYLAGETIETYTQMIAVASFDGYEKLPIVLAEQEVDGQRLNAILVTKTGGRNIHFSNDIFLNDSNLVWQSLQWLIYGECPKVSLVLTRNSSVFVTRNDVDLSKYANVSIESGNRLGEILAQWKKMYGFVCSHFINLGSDSDCLSSTASEDTDWDLMYPIYHKLLSLGNEIATHSWTHPFNVNDLTSEQLVAEFYRSKQEIASRLGISVTGVSIPGNPENLAVDLELAKYFDYINGVGSTYNNAIGYLTPETTQTVYFVPNIDSDFHLIEFKKLSKDCVTECWKNQFDRLIRHANCPIIGFHCHDYGITGMRPDLYNPQIYTDFIAKAAHSGSEFVTFDDLQTRFKTFHRTDLSIEQSEDIIAVKISADDLGKFGLKIHSDRQIHSVTNWYAYSKNMIFLPISGGIYQIKLGDNIAPPTHINRLPQRAKLLTVNGNGRDLEFQFYGEGKVRIILAQSICKNLIVEGVDRYQQTDQQLELIFDRLAKHTVKIRSVLPYIL